MLDTRNVTYLYKTSLLRITASLPLLYPPQPHKVELFHFRGSHGSDGMVLDLHLPVESVPLTTKFVSSNPVHVNVYSIQQHYVIKFVSDFLRVLRFPPPIKLTATI
jgi:hypothetical protein